MTKRTLSAVVAGALVLAPAMPSFAQGSKTDAIDRKVEALLETMRDRWHDMNVPEEDGRLLYETIVKGGYKRALEVGTSTGHSGIWMAWALSKTGGRLVTLEIDEGRYREALRNFEAAGLAELIDARKGDAHDLVKELAGPWDFVFIDADKDWYVNYAKDLIPKLAAGGCLSAHNVREPSAARGRRYGQGADYYDFMLKQPGFSTSVHPKSVGGLALSYKQDKR